jgi:hypothetical protein
MKTLLTIIILTIFTPAIAQKIFTLKQLDQAVNAAYNNKIKGLPLPSTSMVVGDTFLIYNGFQVKHYCVIEFKKQGTIAGMLLILHIHSTSSQHLKD